MRVIVIVGASMAFGLSALGFVAAQRIHSAGTAPTTLAEKGDPAPVGTATAPGIPPDVPVAAHIYLAQNNYPLNNSPGGARFADGSLACDRQGGMGLSRVVEIDTTGGPGFGFEHFKQYDFLRDKEVVLTFDDGPWPENTLAVLKALTDECLKATFFEIGKHAMWHPEITKRVLEAGMTVGTHTWSHKDLARSPYAKDAVQAEQEIEMGNSAVYLAAAGAPVAPFFRFPALQHVPRLLSYLGERNIAIFSTDIDSFDFKLHKPEQVIEFGDDQAGKTRQGHHFDARFPACDREGHARAGSPAQGRRLQSCTHCVEAIADDAPEIRRNG